MSQPTAEQFLQRAFDLELLSDRQLQEVWGSVGSRTAPLHEVTQFVIGREYLTNYQVEKVSKGERSGYFFGPYKVLYAVGAGTFARVYRAVHREKGNVVAIKALRKRYCDKPEQANQFMREGKLGLTLRHPNIVPIHEVICDGKSYFLVMEFVEGWNLRDLVKIRRKIDPLQAIQLMIGMTDGLRYAFEHGLTHRDLKLNNALVTSSMQAKLVDFGLASLDENFEDDTDGELPNARTIDYAALEKASGLRKEDTRSDIYFLGCIFYHMLTGQAALTETRDRSQRLSKQRFLDVVPVQQVDPELSHWVFAVVNKAMKLDPAHRYQTPAAMLADLKLAENQLAGGNKASTAEEAAAALGNYVEPKQHTVLVVESNPVLQNIFREGLKKVNYRVLVIADPERAVARLHQDTASADCVVFCAQDLGESAIGGFNALGSNEKTRGVRAVLLLDEPQIQWKDRAKVDAHRVVLTMPITMKLLRTTLATLMETPVGA